MDNIQGQEPTAPSQGQPQSAQSQVPSSDASGTNPTSGTAVGATPGSEAQQGFQIPEKFQGKSAEDIAKAYVELESHNKKVEMERADLEKLFVPKAEEPTAPQPAAESSTEDPMKALIGELTPAMQKEMMKVITPLAARFEVREMVDRFGQDFVQLAPKVAQAREANPTLSLEAAYKIVAFDNAQSSKRTAYNQGVAEAQQKEQLAQKAQVESSRPSGFRPESIEQAVQNRNVPIAEVVDALGPEYAALKAGYAGKRGKIDVVRKFQG